MAIPPLSSPGSGMVRDPPLSSPDSAGRAAFFAADALLSSAFLLSLAFAAALVLLWGRLWQLLEY